MRDILSVTAGLRPLVKLPGAKSTAALPRDHVVLVSPDDGATSVGINPLQLWPGDERDLVAENALTIFKRIYERYWGPRTDDILKSALLTLLQVEGSTLAHIPLLLTDDAYRARAIAYLVGDAISVLIMSGPHGAFTVRMPFGAPPDLRD